MNSALSITYNRQGNHVHNMAWLQCLGTTAKRQNIKPCFYIVQYSVHWKTSPPGRPVHYDTNSTSLWSIQPCCNYCTQTIHSHSKTIQLLCKDYFTHISTTVYSQILIYTAECQWVNWGVVERTKMSKLRNRGQGYSKPCSLDWESGILPLSYHTPQLHIIISTQTNHIYPGKYTVIKNNVLFRNNDSTDLSI